MATKKASHPKRKVTQKRCKHYDICGLYADADPEAGFCILHSKDQNKDKIAFAKKLKEHRKNKGDNFRYFVFPKWLDFYGATFSKEADFYGATFTEGVDFGGAKFSQKADFYGATFTKSADFSGATFRKEADFGAATFSDGADFWGAIFEKGDINFSLTKFFGRTLFFGIKDKEKKRTKHIFKNLKVYFAYAEISPPNVVIFRDADLSLCLFQGTRLDKIEFTGVKWAAIPDKFGYSRIGVCDEKVLLKSIKSKRKNRNKDKDEFNWEHIERVYRDLKKNYEENRDYERAGDFHYGEKEMRRKNPDTPRIHRYFLHLYCWLSGYGERYLRPLVWATVLLVGCSLGYILLGISKDGIPLKLSDLHHVVLYSLQVMTFIRPTYLEHTTWLSMMLKVVQSIFGPVIIGLFALALRQRLRR